MSSRKFSHADARKRHKRGHSIRRIAKDLGVGPTAVWKALHPEFEPDRPTLDAQCDDCGKPMNSTSRRTGSKRCRSCGQKERHRVRIAEQLKRANL